MKREKRLDLIHFGPEYVESRKKSGAEKCTVEVDPIFTELNAQTEARELSRQIGNEEWRKGNTKYAFEAYEAASVPPSEILEKAKALLQSETLARLCEKEKCQKLQTSNAKCRYNKTIDMFSFTYCMHDDCAPCANTKALNRTYANQIYKLLNWMPRESKRTVISTEDDEYSRWVLADRLSNYKPAVVAALKLVKRLNVVYIQEEQEN